MVIINPRALLACLAGAAILAPLAAAQGDPGEARGRIRVHLANTGVDEDARGGAAFAWSNPAQRARLLVRVRNLEVGAYDLLLDGALLGSVEVDVAPSGEGTRGGLRLRDDRGSIEFDPRGKTLSVAQGGVTFLEAEVPRTRSGRRGARFRTRLELVGEEQPDAVARARFRAHHGRRQLLVGMDRAEAGAYELRVDGETVGRIEVGAEGRGHIRFDSVAHRPGSPWQLLTFPVLGKPIEILSGGEVLFRGALPG